MHTVHDLLCFVVVKFLPGLFTLIRISPLAPRELYDRPSASEIDLGGLITGIILLQQQTSTKENTSHLCLYSMYIIMAPWFLQRDMCVKSVIVRYIFATDLMLTKSNFDPARHFSNTLCPIVIKQSSKVLVNWWRKTTTKQCVYCLICNVCTVVCVARTYIKNK